jgi:hypothetical protein
VGEPHVAEDEEEKECEGEEEVEPWAGLGGARGGGVGEVVGCRLHGGRYCERCASGGGIFKKGYKGMDFKALQSAKGK